MTGLCRMSCVFHFQVIRGAKSLHRTGQGKMETRPAFWRNPFLPANGVGNLKNIISLTQSITDRPAAIRRWKIEPISHRTAPIGTTIKSSQSVAHTQNTANISGVAIGIPATSVDDGLRAVEIALAVEQAENNQAVIWNDVAVAGIFVVAVMDGEFCTRGIPIMAVSGMPGSNICDQAIDDRIGGNETD